MAGRGSEVGVFDGLWVGHCPVWLYSVATKNRRPAQEFDRTSWGSRDGSATIAGPLGAGEALTNSVGLPCLHCVWS